MGFWKKFFGKQKVEPEQEENWEEVIYDRQSVDFRDESQRTRYIMDCLEQLSEATRESELVSGEYNRVTAYLKDIEEIEALPEGEKRVLEHTAQTLQTLAQERNSYQNRANRMKDSEFYQMRNQEREVEEGIRKLRDCEDYHDKVKRDLKKVDRERQAYAYRKAELTDLMNNTRGMAIIFMGAFFVCMVLLFIMQFTMELDATIGYFAAVLAVAVALTVMSIKYMDLKKELARVNRAANRLVQVQNKVKIRYVNNSRLMDYLCMKYNVTGADVLEKLWNNYQKEKEDRKQYAEAEAKQEYYSKQLVAQLSKYPLVDPYRWVNQIDAILDAREMVEIRHELIIQRQALRKQLDYNRGISEQAKKEISEIEEKYPQYSAEIHMIVDKYGNSIVDGVR